MKISNLIVTLALFNTTSIALAQDAGWLKHAAEHSGLLNS